MLQAKIDYFKPSGKWYTSETVNLDVDFAFDASNKVRELRKQNKLPGLASGTWDGPIMVTVYDLPYLILT